MEYDRDDDFVFDYVLNRILFSSRYILLWNWMECDRSDGFVFDYVTNEIMFYQKENCQKNFHSIWKEVTTNFSEFDA